MCGINLGLKFTLKKNLDLDFGFHLSLELEPKLEIFQLIFQNQNMRFFINNCPTLVTIEVHGQLQYMSTE
jgi:hypothetical protein